jgi:serine phosphatase RsbU (regulator of sigma subunit)
VTLSRGDRLYLCTDGIMEAENTSKEEFGVERLLDTLDGSWELPRGDSLSSVVTADDASMLAIERCG